jgi:hypothetical protein
VVVDNDRGWPKKRDLGLEVDDVLRLEVFYGGGESRWLQIALRPDGRWSLSAMQRGSYVEEWGVNGTAESPASIKFARR